ncbi:hypothetical protein ACTXKY_06210 [Corynebacterium variabile]|uniref:hypothetical protein n=1 Tax=Corynebacterium variabile TaxID=1727 RepID=UPI003FD37CE1
MTTLADFPPDSRRVYQLATGYCHMHGRSLMTRAEIHLVAKPATITWLKKHHWIQPLTIPDPYNPGCELKAYRIKHPQVAPLPATIANQEHTSV